MRGVGGGDEEEGRSEERVRSWGSRLGERWVRGGMAVVVVVCRWGVQSLRKKDGGEVE